MSSARLKAIGFSIFFHLLNIQQTFLFSLTFIRYQTPFIRLYATWFRADRWKESMDTCLSFIHSLLTDLNETGKIKFVCCNVDSCRILCKIRSAMTSPAAGEINNI